MRKSHYLYKLSELFAILTALWEKSHEADKEDTNKQALTGARHLVFSVLLPVLLSTLYIHKHASVQLRCLTNAYEIVICTYIPNQNNGKNQQSN